MRVRDDVPPKVASYDLYGPRQEFYLTFSKAEFTYRLESNGALEVVKATPTVAQTLFSKPCDKGSIVNNFEMLMDAINHANGLQ